MSAHVMCITSSSGLPIFTRHKGTEHNLGFSTIASLNGVHMFTKSQQVELLSALTDDYVFAWDEFYDSLTFIGISTGCTELVLRQVLDVCARAMVMIVGLEEIKAQRNVERLKRELRICYPIIDRLLDSLNYGDTQSKNFTDLSVLTEVILTPENHLIQIVLDSYTECVDSMYSCVLIHGKIAAATESWWSLHPVELKLLSLLATLENTSSSKDVPVYLPYRSPNMAFRFVACTLLTDVQVCCLCGPNPPLDEIERSAAQCFKSTMEILSYALQCHPRNFPGNISIDSGILGVLLVNTKKGKYLISSNPQSAKRVTNHRLDILRTFYYQTFNNPEPEGKIAAKKSVDETRLKETYWCSEYHKCYGIVGDEQIICVLYVSSTPIPVMRVLTSNTLKLFADNKQTCW